MSECQTINCPTCGCSISETFVEQKCPRCQALIESKFICGSCHNCNDTLSSTKENLNTQNGFFKKLLGFFR